MVSVAARGSTGLLEREGELGVMAALVARVRGGEGALLVVEGQAGVGKTELLRAAGELGKAEGLRVLRARGSELDRAFAFGVVRQRLEREVADDPELLTGGAEPAAAVFAALRGETHPEEGVFASLQGLHWLVVNLAARKPLLLLADDVHWADTASLRWLVFLAERVEDVKALLVVATRPAEPGADRELLDALLVAPAVRVVRPGAALRRRDDDRGAWPAAGGCRCVQRGVLWSDRRQRVPPRRAALWEDLLGRRRQPLR